jgi:Rrf2 family protein
LPPVRAFTSQADSALRLLEKTTAMKLTRSASYALGIMLRLVEHDSGEPMPAAAIARGCDFPPRFLYRILRLLVDAELLEGQSGPGGGYRLGRRPREISLLEIIEAVEGPREPPELVPVRRKHRKAVEFANEIYEEQEEKLAQRLARVSLEKLSQL